LRKLWSDGLSASKIAAELGPWCTRSAVIGKLHRLGISERASDANVVDGAWTQERIAKLLELSAAGMTGREIARSLSGDFSKRTVNDKLLRLRKAGLAPPPEKRDSEKNTDGWVKAQKGPKKRMGRQLPINPLAEPADFRLPPPRKEAFEPIGQSVPMPIGALGPRNCRWPLWADDPVAEPLYCGSPCADMSAKPVRPYCTVHTHMALGRGTPSERAAISYAKRVDA
jgi:hypothetical protein